MNLLMFFRLLKVINVVEVVRLLVIGAVCITAIIKGGLLAVMFIVIAESAYLAVKEDL